MNIQMPIKPIIEKPQPKQSQKPDLKRSDAKSFSDTLKDSITVANKHEKPDAPANNHENAELISGLDKAAADLPLNGEKPAQGDVDLMQSIIAMMMLDPTKLADQAVSNGEQTAAGEIISLENLAANGDTAALPIATAQTDGTIKTADSNVTDAAFLQMIPQENAENASTNLQAGDIIQGDVVDAQLDNQLGNQPEIQAENQLDSQAEALVENVGKQQLNANDAVVTADAKLNDMAENVAAKTNSVVDNKQVQNIAASDKQGEITAIEQGQNPAVSQTVLNATAKSDADIAAAHDANGLKVDGDSAVDVVDETVADAVVNKADSLANNQKGDSDNAETKEENSEPQAKTSRANDSNSVDLLQGEQLHFNKDTAFVKISDVASKLDKAEVPLPHQVMDSIKSSLLDKKTEFTMQLYPENLGKISVKMVAENGLLTVELIAENPKTQSLLLSSAAEIKELVQTSTATATQVVANPDQNHAMQQNYTEQEKEQQQQQNNSNQQKDDSSQNEPQDFVSMLQQLSMQSRFKRMDV